MKKAYLIATGKKIAALFDTMMNGDSLDVQKVKVKRTKRNTILSKRYPPTTFLCWRYFIFLEINNNICISSI
jgi:hypothetical protein